MNAFQNAANLRGKLNKETLNVAHGAYDLPTSVPMTGEPMTGDNNSLRTLHGEAAPKTFLAAGGLVKKVVAQQRQRMLPKLAEGPQYMAAGGPVCKADGGPVTEPRPTTMAEDTVPAQLHPDEYVIPAEVVRKKGVDFFDRLVQNAQGERKGIVPTMKNGTVYAYGGGYTGNATDDEKQNDLPSVRPETPAPASTNTFRAPTPNELGQTIRARDAAAIDTLAQAQRGMQRPPTPTPSANVSDVGNPNVGASELRLYQQESAPRLAAKAAEERAAQQPPSNSFGKAVSAVGDTVSNAIKAVNPNNYSPEVKNEILRQGDATLDTFKKVKSGLVGAVQSAGAQVSNPENQKALANVTGFGIPSVVDSLQRKGLVGAVGNVARFLTGNTESGKKFDAAVEAQDKRISDAILYGSEGRPGATKADVGGAKTTQAVYQPNAAPEQTASGTSTSGQSATQTTAPSTTPAYSTTALPDGGQRLELTQPAGEKIAPEQIAATDAADAKRLAGILNFNNDRVANVVRGQGGFDPMEQYKQKLAADAEFQNQRDTAKAIQFRNYGQVFPEERAYGQPDNSPVTKQMELDAASKIAATPGNPEYATDKYGRIYQAKGAGADKFNQSIVQQQGGDQDAINAAKSAYFNMQPPSPDMGEEAMQTFKQRKEKLENFFRTWDPDTAKLIDKQKIAGML